MSYPDVIAIQNIRCLWKHSEQLRQRWWSTIITWRIIPWWLTDHHNCQSFKLFSLWQSQHAVCHCQESGKTATQLPAMPRTKWTINIVLFGGKNAGCSFFITFNWCICLLSDVSLRRQASNDPGWEIPGPLLLKSAMLICSIRPQGKADVAGCCSAGSVLRWHEVAPYSVSLICIVWGCFYVKLMQIN